MGVCDVQCCCQDTERAVTDTTKICIPLMVRLDSAFACKPCVIWGITGFFDFTLTLHARFEYVILQFDHNNI